MASLPPAADRFLALAQAVAVAVAILLGFAWLGLWAHRLHRDVKVQVDRMEAEQRGAIEYAQARDRAWARAIGLPEPPFDDETEDQPKDAP